VSSPTLPIAAEALNYAARGILIFPLWHAVDGVCQCSRRGACDRAAKHPRTPKGLPNWGATTNPQIVARWWTQWPDAGIGMPAGANRLAVIDVDPAHGGADTITVLDEYCLQQGIDMFTTRRVRTGSGGEHLIYREPPGGIKTGSNTFGPDAPGVDTRGRGGYIIVPPSRHACGGRYEVIDNGCTIATWPDCLTRLLEPEPRPTLTTPPQAAPVASGRAERWAAAALTGECETLAAIPLGEGHGKHDELNKRAYKIGRIIAAGWLNPHDAHRALMQAIQAWPGHPDRAHVIDKAFREAAGNPHPGPATRGGLR
jgi:hypothetical protein